MTGTNPSTETDTTLQNLSSISVSGPEEVKDSLHALIWNDLPRYVKQAGSRHGTGFDDCRIEFYRDYRILFITPEGLGLDMDHRGEDASFFQADALDIVYSEEVVEYIGRRKAEEYDSYGKASLFRVIWSDVVEELGGLKPGPGILQP